MMISAKNRNSSFSIANLIPWLICGLAAVFYCYEYLLRIAPSAMGSELMAAYGITSEGLGLLGSVYYFAYTPMQLPVGVMMDKYGPRRILTLAVLFCALGTAMMGLSNSYFLALVGRFLIGFGSAFAFVGVLKLASIWLRPDRFALIAGLTTSLGMIGALVGQNILSNMVANIGLEYTLLYSSLVGFLLFPIVWFIVRDERKDPNYNPTSNTSLTYRQLWREIMQVIANKQIWITGLVALLIMLPTTIFAEFCGSLFLETYFGFDSQTAVKATSMVFLGWAVGGPIVGFISDTIKNRRILIFLGAIIGLGMMVTLIYGPRLQPHMVFTFLFLFGVASSVQTICFAVAKEHSPISVAGTAIAMTNFIVVLAGFCQWLVGKLLDFSRSGFVDALGNPVYTVADFKSALCILPASMLLGFLLCFFIKETKCRPVLE